MIGGPADHQLVADRSRRLRVDAERRRLARARAGKGSSAASYDGSHHDERS